MSSEPWPLPDTALTSGMDIAILGKKGRGKSYAAKGLIERMLDLGERVLVLDPLGHWWELKASANGEQAGYPVPVFGGQHADLEIGEASGRALARVLVAERISAIVDLGSMRKAEQQRLVGDLLDELFACNRAPLTIVLEEADAFAPQSPMGDAIRVLGEVDRIARRGRAFGFRLLTITQRPAKLNKDVLTQLSVLIALGVTSPQDRDAIKAWVEGNGDRDKARAVYESLASLPRGEGWVWAPDFDILKRVRIPKIKTLDTSSTPASGEQRIEPKKLAQADIGRLREMLASEAPSGARASAPAIEAQPFDLEAEVNRRVGKKVEAEKAAWIEDGKRLGFNAAKAQMRAALDGLAWREKRPEVSLVPEKASSAAGARRAPLEDEKLSVSAAAFVRAAMSVYPVLLTWGQLGVLCGRKTRGGSFNTARKQVLEGFSVEQGSLLRLNQAAFDYFGEEMTVTPRSEAELLERIIQALPTPANEMLAAIVKDGPIDTASLALRLGRAPRGGSWNTGIAILRANDLIRETPQGWVPVAYTVRAA